MNLYRSDSERHTLAATEQDQCRASPSDHGRIKIRESGASYVSTAYWAAILDSIAELRDHLEEDEEQTMLTPNTVQPHADFPCPQLLYSDCAARVTPALILDSIPPRPVVDRLVSRYFNVRDMDLGKAPNGMRFRFCPLFFD